MPLFLFNFATAGGPEMSRNEFHCPEVDISLRSNRWLKFETDDYIGVFAGWAGYGEWGCRSVIVLRPFQLPFAFLHLLLDFVHVVHVFQLCGFLFGFGFGQFGFGWIENALVGFGEGEGL